MNNPKRKPILSILIEERMKKDNLSLRAAAKEIDVSHTTIARVIQGETFDIDTLILICNWLSINPATILEEIGHPKDDLAPKISAFLQSQPKLEKEFRALFDQVQTVELPANIINDILTFIAFKSKTA